MQSKEKNSLFAFIVVFFAGLGGFLFGYFTSIISGALIFLQEEFSLTTWQDELAVGIILIGALFGALLAGTMADFFGRKITIIVTTVLFILGTALIIGTHSFDIFLLGRFITGIAVGIISLTAPLYLAEIAPSHRRGAFVAVNQLSITIGILVGYLINYAFSTSGQWRWMFGLGLIPAAIKLVGMFFVPESPAWLITKGKSDKAMSVLEKIRKGAEWKEAFFHDQNNSAKPIAKGWRELFKPSMRVILVIGITISLLQQVTGINAVTFYCAKIFQMVGYSGPQEAILASVFIAATSVIVTCFAVWLTDKIGRKPLLLIGFLGMTFTLAALSIALYSSVKFIGPVSIASLMGYIGFFAIGIGPLAYVILSEIFPTSLRGKAMTIGVFANWVANLIISSTFLSLKEAVGMGGAFAIYAAFAFLGFWIVLRFLPETKHKSPEEIEKAFQKIL
jgi:sugar porter (SP) family MFS transporter